MTDPAKKVATYEDVLAAPPHMVAEVIGGELYLHPRPAKPHAAAASALSEELGPPFKRGRGGPGGWIILYEPELLGTWRDEARVRAEPFDAIELELAALWHRVVLQER